jgi:diaminopimelate decarboxylase
MTDLVRPSHYQAYHAIVDVASRHRASRVVDVVGPVCETGDYLALERMLPPFEPGDLMAVMTAGAYGAVMSSTYNSRPLVPEVLVKGESHCVVRPRPSHDDLIALDRLPDWLAPADRG